MRQELVYTHRYLTDRRDCATLSVQALIPHPISEKSIHALLGNALSLCDAGAVVADELRDYGLKTVLIEKAENVPPSKFFKEIAHTLCHGRHLGLFIGGFVGIELPDQVVDHMVAITSLHEKGKRKKVTLVDAGAKKENAHLVRKVPLEWLDRNIMNPNGFGPTAIALIAIPNEKMDDLPTDNRDALILRKLATEGTVFAYNSKQSKKSQKRQQKMKYC